MSQHYSDPSREDNPYALPDIEVFEMDGTAPLEGWHADNGYPVGVRGWFWWVCQPGCIPDSDFFGPFDTEAEAIADAQKGLE